MLNRDNLLTAITERFQHNPIVALLGPRQVGKTTLARFFAEQAVGSIIFYDLESPVDLRRLSMPLQALSQPADWIIIDEIQRQPELFEILRVLVDRPDARTRFLILGSASPELIKGVTESLAGRVAFIDIPGFSLNEIGDNKLRQLWYRGGFPRSFLASDDNVSAAWREDFVRTFLERDIPALGIRVPPETLRRFWMMVAHYHGQIWNGAEFGRSLGSSEITARRYLDILAGAYVVRILPPWFENISKRQVKAPKIYIRDSGLLHSLLDLPDEHALLGHPKAGASWEGFALEEILKHIGDRNAFFWATHAGAELDLMVSRGGKRYGIEFKLADAPSTTRSMHVALETLNLEKLLVVYPGSTSYLLTDKIIALPLYEALKHL